MIIDKIHRQHRRDFWADYRCEDCGTVEMNKSGYDDRNFHDNVVPNMKCPVCGESSVSLGTSIQFTPTKYGGNETV